MTPIRDNGRVLLLSMPFGALERQSLGLSLLKARLDEGGKIGCDLKYLTFTFAEAIGFEAYQWVSSALPYTAFAGDWLFTESLYGSRPDDDEQYVREILRETWQISDQEIAWLLKIRASVPQFLDYCVDLIPWQDYSIIGFTSTFEQNLASLNLAYRVKRIRPKIKVVFGGANWEGPMGLELHRRFQFVDYVFSGEADQNFPEFAEQVASGKRIDWSDPRLNGVVYRKDGASVLTGPLQPTQQMDQLPFPDFSDYFRDLDESSTNSSVVPTLLFETSRGCWWGAKSHCTFCGLNGGAMAFRSKSADRAVSELSYLVDKWKIESVEVVDNILDMKYFDTMLPALSRIDRPLEFFYEVKANLTRKHLEVLRDAGVRRIQPGIESMSDHVLQLMGKGCTALQNVQLLKWCQEYGIVVEWNLLYGFPGELPEDYRKMLTLLKAIRHLKPPGACGPVRLDRFSPYHNTPEKYGMTNVRPMRPYEYLYPFDPESVSRIAYYFEYDYENGIEPRSYAGKVIAYAEDWKRQPEAGTLTAVASNRALVLVDTRSAALQGQVPLRGIERVAYEYCDEATTSTSLARHLNLSFQGTNIAESEVRSFLDSLIENRLMVTDGQRYLSLATRARRDQANPSDLSAGRVEVSAHR